MCDTTGPADPVRAKHQSIEASTPYTYINQQDIIRVRRPFHHEVSKSGFRLTLGAPPSPNTNVSRVIKSRATELRILLNI